MTVTGEVFDLSGVVADNAVQTIWDEDSSSPDDFDFFFFVCDQAVQIQLIAQTFHAVVDVDAGVPFTLSSRGIFTAANTTILVGGTPATLEDIDSIVVSNDSGSSANYVAFLVD
jgi:hypothetical protein